MVDKLGFGGIRSHTSSRQTIHLCPVKDCVVSSQRWCFNFDSLTQRNGRETAVYRNPKCPQSILNSKTWRHESVRCSLELKYTQSKKIPYSHSRLRKHLSFICSRTVQTVVFALLKEGRLRENKIGVRPDLATQHQSTATRGLNRDTRTEPRSRGLHAQHIHSK